MKKRGLAVILATALGMISFSGCSHEAIKLYEQANKDLEHGSYEYALSEYLASVQNEIHIPESYRGAGIAELRMGNYEQAIEYFTSALGCEKVGKALRRDLLEYRASTEYKIGQFENAMIDCQTLAAEYELDADSYYLSGKVALAMDSYGEASSNFQNAYAKDSTYDMAIQIYQAYIEREMEADGTSYLETALLNEPKKAEDYCDRGLVYYYMEDYETAAAELTEATKQGSKEAYLYLGMVHLAKNDVSNARAMYQEYISHGDSPAKGYNGLVLCDIREKNYANALLNIESGIATANTEEMQNLLFNEIVVYEKQLDFPMALQKAKEYLEVFPDDAVMKKEYVFLKTRV